MPEFILDHGTPESARAFHALDSFTQGYIEAMFFTDCEVGTIHANEGDRESLVEMQDRDSLYSPERVWNPDTDSSLPGDVTVADLASETLARIILDCARFQAANCNDIAEAISRPGYDDSRAGHDFWLTRNGHGAGFWDRTELESDDSVYEAFTAQMVAAAARGDNSAWGAALAKRNAMQALSVGARLSDACKAFPNVDSYLGDDGKVYLS